MTVIQSVKAGTSVEKRLTFPNTSIEYEIRICPPGDSSDGVQGWQLPH